MSDSTVVTTVGPPLGYLVGFRRSGVAMPVLPSFSAIWQTREMAEIECDQLRRERFLDTDPVLLEVREAGP